MNASTEPQNAMLVARPGRVDVQAPLAIEYTCDDAVGAVAVVVQVGAAVALPRLGHDRRDVGRESATAVAARPRFTTGPAPGQSCTT